MRTPVAVCVVIHGTVLACSDVYPPSLSRFLYTRTYMFIHIYIYNRPTGVLIPVRKTTNGKRGGGDGRCRWIYIYIYIHLFIYLQLYVCRYRPLSTYSRHAGVLKKPQCRSPRTPVPTWRNFFWKESFRHGVMSRGWHVMITFFSTASLQ